MDNRQHRTAFAYRRVVDYLDTYPLPSPPPLLVKTRTQLEGSIARITELSTRQRNAPITVGGMPADQASRKLRREKMMPLIRIARPLLKFAPGVEMVMQVPHARSDSLTVANAALDMVKFLKPHKKLLLSAGLPADFLGEMRREAEALAQAARRAEKVRRVRSGATAALARELKKAKELVTVIEGIIMFHQKDEVALFRWRHDRRVGAKMGRPKQKKNPPPVS
jgi:hypothetical protein